MLKLYWADDDCLLPGDRGLAYGDGLFETIRVNGDSAPLLVYHLDRLVRDAGRLGISLSRPELESAVAGAMQRYGAIHGGSHWVLKLVVTRGSGGRGYRLVGRHPADAVAGACRERPGLDQLHLGHNG